MATAPVIGLILKAAARVADTAEAAELGSAAHGDRANRLAHGNRKHAANDPYCLKLLHLEALARHQLLIDGGEKLLAVVGVERHDIGLGRDLLLLNLALELELLHERLVEEADDLELLIRLMQQHPDSQERVENVGSSGGGD